MSQGGSDCGDDVVWNWPLDGDRRIRIWGTLSFDGQSVKPPKTTSCFLHFRQHRFQRPRTRTPYEHLMGRRQHVQSVIAVLGILLDCLIVWSRLWNSVGIFACLQTNQLDVEPLQVQTGCQVAA
jgi:hypothetical protein